VAAAGPREAARVPREEAAVATARAEEAERPGEAVCGGGGAHR
jgi:hypothetical protein